MSPIPKLIVSLIVLGLLYTTRWQVSDTFENIPPIKNSAEFDLMHRAYGSTSVEERQRLLAELDALPVESYPFYHRWLLIHEIDPYACWTDEGYDASRSELTREIQWLEATTLGISDIDNGGLLQFFENGSGTFAPEMAEWFEQAGLPEAAGTLRKAIAVFGAEFPRSPEKRIAFLQAKTDDPFYELDEAFYGQVATQYDAAADRWIRERCGIGKLSDAPPKVSAH